MMLETLKTTFTYVFDLGILVFFHELGHYLAARSQGVVVEVFSVGFGPALVSWRAKSGTKWQISALPLGGYVKMQGWGEQENTTPAVPGSFSAASLGSKALIVVAGPLANFLLAFVLFTGLYAIHGRAGPVLPVVDSVLAGSAAAQGGLLPGDKIIQANGQTIRTFMDLLQVVVPHPDQDVTFTIDRGGAVLSKEILLGHKQDDGDTIGSLGITGPAGKIEHLSMLNATVTAAQDTWAATAATAMGLYNLVRHGQGLHQLRGVIGIAQITGKVEAFGLASLVNLVAIISINLGLINLVPIPMLDGGHLLFYGAEAVFRRRIPARVQDIGLRLGVAVILSLFLLTTFNDLTRLGVASWVAHVLG